MVDMFTWGRDETIQLGKTSNRPTKDRTLHMIVYTEPHIQGEVCISSQVLEIWSDPASWAWVNLSPQISVDGQQEEPIPMELVYHQQQGLFGRMFVCVVASW